MHVSYFDKLSMNGIKSNKFHYHCSENIKNNIIICIFNQEIDLISISLHNTLTMINKHRNLTFAM